MDSLIHVCTQSMCKRYILFSLYLGSLVLGAWRTEKVADDKEKLGDYWESLAKSDSSSAF